MRRGTFGLRGGTLGNGRRRRRVERNVWRMNQPSECERMIGEQTAICTQFLTEHAARLRVERCALKGLKLLTQRMALFNKAEGFRTEVREAVLLFQWRVGDLYSTDPGAYIPRTTYFSRFGVRPRCGRIRRKSKGRPRRRPCPGRSSFRPSAPRIEYTAA